MTGVGEDKPDVAIDPWTVFIAMTVLGFVVRVFVGGWLPLPQILAEGLGGMIIMGAFGFALWSISIFVEGGETMRPATSSGQLFTSGPFRFSRNPIYLAMVLFGIGFGLATHNLWIVSSGFLTGLVFHFFIIPGEEDYLKRRFGSEYADYCDGVRRWL